MTALHPDRGPGRSESRNLFRFENYSSNIEDIIVIEAPAD